MTAGQKTAAELEREVEAQRAGLAHTLDAISSRLTPGQILDEAWEFARGSGGGAFARNLGASVRDNPLPVGLITSGIAWLISGRGRPLPRTPENRQRSGREPAEDAFSKLRADGVPGGHATDGKSGPHIVARAAESTSAFAEAAGGRLSEAAGVAVDAGRIAMEDARISAERLSRSAGESARHLRDRTRETGRQVRERADAFANEQPVVLAVAGLAIGALMGALARSTAAESRIMGGASDLLKAQVQDAAASGAGKAARTAERTYQAVSEEAENEGLTAASVREAADDLAGRVRKVAKKGRAKLEEELDS